MRDTQEVTDRRVKITLCSELLPRTSTQSPRVVGLGFSVSPGIRDTTPQEARSWLFRHTQAHTSYEVKIATLPLMGAKPPNLCEPPFCSKKHSGTFFSRGRAGVNVTDWVYHLVKKETLRPTLNQNQNQNSYKFLKDFLDPEFQPGDMNCATYAYGHKRSHTYKGI